MLHHTSSVLSKLFNSPVLENIHGVLASHQFHSLTPLWINRQAKLFAQLWTKAGGSSLLAIGFIRARKPEV